MDGLRKFGLIMSAILVGPAVIATVVALIFSRTTGNPDYIKQTLTEVRTYEAVGNFLEAQADRSEDLESKVLQEALTKAASEERLKRLVEQAVDESYQVLEGDKPAKEFRVNISEFKDAFVANLESGVTKNLSKLPVCTAANPPRSTNPLEFNCLPPNANIANIADQVRKEAIKDSDLLRNEDVTIDALGEKVEQANAETPPSQTSPTDTFQQIADSYQLSKLALPIAAGAALLTAAGVVILSHSRLKGGRRLGYIIAGNAVVFAIVSFLARVLAQNFPINNAEGSILPATALELAGQKFVVDFATLSLQFSGALFLLGLGTAIICSVILSKHNSDNSGGSDKAPDQEPPLELEKVEKKTKK